MAFVHEHVAEEILIRLDAKDLVRYRKMCKSWHSLITSSRFVRRHLNHSYNKDRYNDELGHRRITLFERYNFVNPYHLVGSSNGLVCIYSSGYKLIVGNPLTREVKRLKYPPWIGVPVCWGFGYDSSRDDYMVIVGAQQGENQICVRVLSLKSNAWSVITEGKYSWFITQDGILCNRALHWIIGDENMRKSIISYDLSTDEFKEFPQPEDARYRSINIEYLGIVKEHLCIIGYSCVDNVWLMKKYNVKESWEMLQRHDHNIEMKNDILHFLRLGLPKTNDASWFFRTSEHLCREYMDAHRYVRSLVSPHVNSS